MPNPVSNIFGKHSTNGHLGLLLHQLEISWNMIISNNGFVVGVFYVIAVLDFSVHILTNNVLIMCPVYCSNAC